MSKSETARLMVSLDEEKRGRLTAENRVLALEEKIRALNAEWDDRLIRLKNNHVSAREDLRANFLNELAGLRSMLAEAERQAWHGRLMAQALSLGMTESDFERIREECWGLMKSGVEGQRLSPGGAIVVDADVPGTGEESDE